MTKIYVFTSTGNSLHLARTLAAELGECEILSIPRVMGPGEWAIEGETVGFVFPCYYGSVPQIVSRFISEASSVEAQRFFALVSAGRSTGLSMEQLQGLLKERGQTLNYGRSVELVSNYMNGWYYSLLMPSDEKISILQDSAESAAVEAAKEITACSTSVDRGSRMNHYLPRLISPGRYVKDSRPWDREFSVDESCTGCGSCVKACPVGNIHLTEGKPSFSGDCQRCMGCVQFCPGGSIRIRGKAMDKKRYRHRAVSLKELAAFHREEMQG